MTVGELETRLGEAAARLEQLAESMEAVAGKYLDGLADWLGGRFDDEVAAAVTAEAEVTRALGTEGLGRLKQDLAEVRAHLPDLVRRRVGVPLVWPHRWDRGAAFPADRYGEAPDEDGDRVVALPADLRSRLEVLAGSAGGLLARSGYRRYARRNWRRAYVRSDYFPPEYLGDLAGHERFEELLAEYAGLYGEYVAAIEELRATEGERSAIEIRDLWASA
jgi:hypothetical protein